MMKSSNFLLLQFLLCLVICFGCSTHGLRLSSFSNSTKLGCHAHSLSLLQLKNSFSIDNSSSWNDCDSSSCYPKTESWKEGSDCCSWDGVTCDPVTGHVIELDLSCGCLSGTIHPNSTLFSLFPHLRKLNLAFNDFTGSSVSDGFGRFSSLTHLNLSSSWFSGPISPQISHLSNLLSLDLSLNDAEFITPYGLDSLVQNLTKLQKLHLRDTSVSSPVHFPNSLMLNRSSLISLDLSWCGLYGRFPDHDIHLPNLQLLSLAGIFDLSGSFPRFNVNNSLMELHLSFTNLSGELPTSIGNDLKSLQTLDLSHCEFSGSIPTSIGDLKSLQTLDLSGCEFSGSIPTSLGNLKSLQTLDLSQCAFSGSIPISIGTLKSLQTLDLSQCAFSGSIPASIGNLKSLQTLRLSECEFSGSISDTLENLTQITFLELRDNHFSGEIPNVFHNGENLVSLDLSLNNFSGQLPPSIGNLTNLIWLDISENQLEGVIPCSHVNGFPSLYSVDFSYNMLNGTIPPWLYTLPSLEMIYLSHNKFTGPIGDFQSGSLWVIDLSVNELDGPLPSSIFELVNLSSLYLSSNKLSGILETSQFENLIHLFYLDLSNNMLSFTCMSNNSNSMLPNIDIVDLSNNNISGIWTWNLGLHTLFYLNLSYNSISGFQMLQWKSMKYLDLHSNSLQGPLPIPLNSSYFFSVSHNKLIGEISPLICEVRSIQILDLSYNNLSGMLPHCLGKFSNLSVLNLRRNRFHGVIPQTFSQGNALRTINFNGNQLEGLVPRSLIICRELEVLDLGNNKINDTFPHWLATLPKLQVLVLRSNHFHGDIISFSKFVMKSPFTSLRILDLAHNDFKGNLPGLYLTSLKAIMNINESNIAREYMGDKQGYYHDSTTITVKGNDVDMEKILKTFTTIDLSCNKFQGEIPECIGNLSSLRGLNLSHNNLTGHIPLSFKNLKMLESLDLSSNKLRGMIPQQLTSVTFLEVLNLSHNDLTGIIPRGNQFDTFGNDSYIGNSRLCGYPLLKGCTATAEIPYTSQDMGAKLKIDQFDWRSAILMGYGCGIVIGLSLGCLIFMSGKPEWLVWIIDKNIFNCTAKYKRSRRGGARRS